MITFRNTATFVFAMNGPFLLEMPDQALLSRIVTIPFARTIPLEYQDPDLLKKLLLERDAIASLALQCFHYMVLCGRDFSGHYELNQVVDQAYAPVSAGVEQSEKPRSYGRVEQFLAEYCVFGPKVCYQTLNIQLYEAFQASGLNDCLLTQDRFIRLVKQITLEQRLGEIEAARWRDGYSNPRQGLKGIGLKAFMLFTMRIAIRTMSSTCITSRQDHKVKRVSAPQAG